jgi:ribosomal protein L44E
MPKILNLYCEKCQDYKNQSYLMLGMFNGKLNQIYKCPTCHTKNVNEKGKTGSTTSVEILEEAEGD